MKQVIKYGEEVKIIVGIMNQRNSTRKFAIL